MDNELIFRNTIGLPDDLIPVLLEGVCEYASIKKDGTPVTSPVIPFPGHDGSTIDVQTGLTYPLKAERARKNPKVCLLYSEPKASKLERPPTVLVYGKASVFDSDLQANTDRYVQMSFSRFRTFSAYPGFVLRKMMDGYLARIWIAVTPLKLLWWPEGDLEAVPQVWHAPEGTQAPPSDPPPKPLSNPHDPIVESPADWRKDITYALDHLGRPVITVVDRDGYPVPFRAQGASLEPDGVHLELYASMPAEARGRACLTFHTLDVVDNEMVANDNCAFLGELVEGGNEALFKVDRCLPNFSLKRDPVGMVSLMMSILRMRRRLKVEAARRGQPVPVVNLP